MDRPSDPRRNRVAPSPWHALAARDVLLGLGTDPERGLDSALATRRLQEVGPNQLHRPRPEPWWEEAAEALTEPLILLLMGVGILYALLGEVADAVTIFLVILAVAGVEVVNEGRAKRAIAALRALGSPNAYILRDGRAERVPTADLVPGDLVLLGPGERVPADLRLLESAALRIDESSLTGESAPVAKSADPVLPVETELAERRNMVYAGTAVVAGRGRGVVVATARDTEVGRIAALAEEAREPRTPLQRQMRELSGWLLWLALGFSLLVPLLGALVVGQPLQQMLLTGLSLAFATVPEELPILITIVLGLGAYHLSRRRAIVKRLRAAETLGSVSAVGTDKTGTLTENRMRVARVVVDEGETEKTNAVSRLLAVGALASDAQMAPGDGRVEFLGDPTEVALLAAAEEGGISVRELRGQVEVLEEYPFDDPRKRMAVVYRREGERRVAAKGAPESILAVCSTLMVGGETMPLEERHRRALSRAVEEMAAEGLRVLAFAERRLDPEERLQPENVEADLTLVGLAGLEDPPRPEVPAAVAALKAAGVRVLMLTGDHPETARAIARRVGIPADRVAIGREVERLSEEELREMVREVFLFARITPEHKLRVVRALAARGDVVAVTGDGVNDAPALREAAIGVAMGQTGSDVAREAADLILVDDNFATVATAVEDGRRLYENLRKGVRYYLAAKVALIGSSLSVVLAQLPVPFAPVQIIVMELFMDLVASTTFVAERPEEDVMARPPRDPRQPFVDGSMRWGVLAGGLSLAAAVVLAYLWGWSQGLGAAVAQTMAFATWMAGHLALAAHMRSERQPLLRLGLFSNRAFLVWAVGVLLLVALGVSIPFLRERLHLALLPMEGWLVVLGAGLLAPAWWEAVKWARWRPAGPSSTAITRMQ